MVANRVRRLGGDEGWGWVGGTFYALALEKDSLHQFEFIDDFSGGEIDLS